MKLAKGEYTIRMFVEWLNKNYKKPSGKPFKNIDAIFYAKRGRMPSTYGGWNVVVKRQHDINFYRLSKGDE